MNKEGRRDWQLFTWFDTLERYALDRACAPGPQFCYTIDGFPVAVGGITIGRPGVGTAWMMATTQLLEEPGARYDLLRIVRAILKRAMGSPDLHRLEAWTRETWPGAVRFAKAAGLKFEGRHPGMCSDGSAVLSFAATREVS